MQPASMHSKFEVSRMTLHETGSDQPPEIR
jgi:hypothetical protein